MNDEELSFQKKRIKGDLLNFEDKGDFTNILSPNSVFYKRLATIIRSDKNVRNHQAQEVLKYNKVVGFDYE